MVILKAKDTSLTFALEPNDVCNDSKELLTLKARTVRGVSQVTFNEEVCLVHIQRLGRGPLQCEQAIAEAMG